MSLIDKTFYQTFVALDLHYTAVTSERYNYAVYENLRLLWLITSLVYYVVSIKLSANGTFTGFL